MVKERQIEGYPQLIILGVNPFNILDDANACLLEGQGFIEKANNGSSYILKCKAVI